MLKTKRDVERAYRLAKKDGLSLRELGERYGVSYETIRQAFKEHGLSTNGHRRYAKRDLSVKEAWERKDEIFDSYRRHGSIVRVAKEIDLPTQVISEVVAKMPLRNAYRHRGSNSDNGREKVRSALREAWNIVGHDRPLTTTAYRRLAPAHGLPSLPTVLHPYGSFYEACQDAKVKANPSSRRYSSYSEESVLEGIRHCAKDLGRAPSYEDYQVWHRDHPEHPSGPTIRSRLTWAKAVIKALG